MNKFRGIVEKIKKHKKLTITGVVILIIAIIGTTVMNYVDEKSKHRMASMNQTQTSEIERRTLVSSVSATGTLTSVNSKSVSVNLNNVAVKSVDVQLGDMVEAGQVLCEFESEDIEQNLEDAQTAFKVSKQKTQMDLTAAERNLEEAKENYDTELKRGNTDLDVAYNDYVVALEDVEDAESAYNTAKTNTAEKKSGYEKQQSLLAQKKGQIDTNGSSEAGKAAFETKKAELQTKISDSNGEIVDNADILNGISIDTDLSSISESSFTYTANAESHKSEVSGLIGSLKEQQNKYKTALTLEAEYSALQKSLSEWQSAYQSAVQSEKAAESTYEQQVSAASTKLQAYQKQQRNLDDTTKNAENSVISKTESLTTAQLNALTSGTSEEAKVEEYKQQLEDCTVKAPISGIVSAINVSEGDTYNGSAIVTIDDISSFEVTTEIDEYDISKIKKGQKAVIKTNATGEEELEGTIKIVSPKATAGTNEVTYTVTISVDTPNEALRMDMTAKLSIILESKEDVLTVPYDAVQEDEEGNSYIEVLDTTDMQTLEPVNMEQGDDSKKAEAEKELPRNGGEENFDMEMLQTGEMLQKRKKSEEQSAFEAATRKIFVETGIESDYYIEVISDEITEGMQVIVPQNDSENNGNIQIMMRGQGPMGGF